MCWLVQTEDVVIRYLAVSFIVSQARINKQDESKALNVKKAEAEGFIHN